MSGEDAFQAAVQAVISGDVEGLRALLEAHPGLARARAAAEHRGTLLHYAAANGVEDELQRTPANAVEVARALLEAGAEVDATFLDGKSGTTPLVSLVTSVHPHRAGVAADLVDLFLDAGAEIEGLNGDGEPLRLALRFGYPASAEALFRRGARVTSLAVAAGLGRADLMGEFMDMDGAGAAALAEAFMYACMNGRVEAAGLLLEAGVEIDAMPEGIHANPCTGLHFAALNGHLELAEFLVSRRADPGARDPNFNGTPRGWAEHSGQDAVAEYLRRIEEA